MRVVTYPGRGTDEYEDFEDWEMCQLRERASLAQEFDRLADAIVAEALWSAKTATAKSKYGMQFEMGNFREIIQPGRMGVALRNAGSGFTRSLSHAAANGLYVADKLLKQR